MKLKGGEKLKKKITKEYFCKLYNSGLLISEIAEKLKVSNRTVITYAKKLGMSRGKGNRTSNRKAFDF